MKKIFVVLVLLIIIFQNAQIKAVYANTDEFYYTGNVEHLFTHCLLAQPSLALSKTNSMSQYYAKDCITPNEFASILDSLYKNNYMLINPNLLFKEIDGVVKQIPFKFIKDKKPLIISFDDVNYDSKKLGKGMCDKITLTEDGELASLTKIGDRNYISKTNEFIPILESFIKLRPDFSFSGAKGMINLTGYDGILGYRTNNGSPNQQEEIEKVKPIIKKLKENGWCFSSHSYGHYHMKNISDDKFAKELEKWKNEVEPLVGKTSIYVYPYGEWQILDEEKNVCKKHQLLVDYGFKLFCSVGVNQFCTNFPKTNEYQILFMDRVPLDGHTLTTKKSALKRFFDCDNVLEKKFRV